MFHGCEESFCAILGECDRFSDANFRGDAVRGSSQASPIRLAFSTEFIMNLFFVATESHSFEIRMKAIGSLRQYRRREKYWDSFHAACLAEWLLEEEQKTRALYHAGKKVDRRQLVFSSLQIYVDDDGFGSSFRRPSWAQVEVESQREVTQHWVCLEEAAFGSPAFPKATGKRLCYGLEGPVWPSAAKMVAQMALYGQIKGLMDLGG